MSSIFEDIETFNKEVVGIDRNTPRLLERKENEWLCGALREEIEEFLEAYEQRSIVGCVDALIDLIYFASGGLTRMGVSHTQSEKIFDQVHSANMRKKGGAKEGRKVQSDLDAYKPKDWKSPEEAIASILGVNHAK